MQFVEGCQGMIGQRPRGHGVFARNLWLSLTKMIKLKKMCSQKKSGLCIFFSWNLTVAFLKGILNNYLNKYVHEP